MSGARQLACEHAPPPHFAVEDFRAYAFRELEISPPWVPGVCFNPDCGRAFVLARDWQIYCCESCRRADGAEMRKWGARLAMSALVWRMGKYERHDAGVRNLARAARRHVGHVQSAWLGDRVARAARGGA